LSRVRDARAPGGRTAGGSRARSALRARLAREVDGLLDRVLLPRRVAVRLRDHDADALVGVGLLELQRRLLAGLLAADVPLVLHAHALVGRALRAQGLADLGGAGDPVRRAGLGLERTVGSLVGRALGLREGLLGRRELLLEVSDLVVRG